jgi:hypothetical protein
VHRLLGEQGEDRLADGAAARLVAKAPEAVTGWAAMSSATAGADGLVDGIWIGMVRPTAMAEAAGDVFSHGSSCGSSY